MNASVPTPSPDADAPLLKSDLFGDVRLVRVDDGQVIRRDTRATGPACAWLARRLARREARALAALVGLPGTPRLLAFDGKVLDREWIAGLPMQRARPADPRYFHLALTLLRRLHQAGVTHNDLAKEPNWLVTGDGHPAIVDFQLAIIHRRRGCLFRVLAREDLRHLFKHKRTYWPDGLSARQSRILETPAWTSRLWRATGKRTYRFVTRRLLGWADREGATDRRFR